MGREWIAVFVGPPRGRWRVRGTWEGGAWAIGAEAGAGEAPLFRARRREARFVHFAPAPRRPGRRPRPRPGRRPALRVAVAQTDAAAPPPELGPAAVTIDTELRTSMPWVDLTAELRAKLAALPEEPRIFEMDEDLRP